MTAARKTDPEPLPGSAIPVAAPTDKAPGARARAAGHLRLAPTTEAPVPHGPLRPSSTTANPQAAKPTRVKPVPFGHPPSRAMEAPPSWAPITSPTDDGENADPTAASPKPPRTMGPRKMAETSRAQHLSTGPLLGVTAKPVGTFDGEPGDGPAVTDADAPGPDTAAATVDIPFAQPDADAETPGLWTPPNSAASSPSSAAVAGASAPGLAAPSATQASSVDTATATAWQPPNFAAVGAAAVAALGNAVQQQLPTVDNPHPSATAIEAIATLLTSLAATLARTSEGPAAISGTANPAGAPHPAPSVHGVTGPSFTTVTGPAYTTITLPTLSTVTLPSIGTVTLPPGSTVTLPPGATATGPTPVVAESAPTNATAVPGNAGSTNGFAGWGARPAAGVDSGSAGQPGPVSGTAGATHGAAGVPVAGFPGTGVVPVTGLAPGTGVIPGMSVIPGVGLVAGPAAGLVPGAGFVGSDTGGHAVVAEPRPLWKPPEIPSPASENESEDEPVDEQASGPADFDTMTDWKPFTLTELEAEAALAAAAPKPDEATPAAPDRTGPRKLVAPVPGQTPDAATAPAAGGLETPGSPPVPMWNRAVPTRSTRPPLVWLVGVHGGAGVSSLAASVGWAGDAGQRWPARIGMGPDMDSPLVVLVARNHMHGMNALYRALVAYRESATPAGSQVVGVLTVADAARPLSNRVADRREEAEGLAVALGARTWRLGWLEQWRAFEPHELAEWNPAVEPSPVDDTDPTRTPPQPVRLLAEQILIAARTAGQQLTDRAHSGAREATP